MQRVARLLSQERTEAALDYARAMLGDTPREQAMLAYVIAHHYTDLDEALDALVDVVQGSDALGPTGAGAGFSEDPNPREAADSDGGAVHSQSVARVERDRHR
jgi:hypothetical protein